MLDARVVPINERYFGRLTDTVWLAFMSVGILVVLISCANVANLMIERSLPGAATGDRASIVTPLGGICVSCSSKSAVLAAAGGACRIPGGGDARRARLPQPDTRSKRCPTG